MATEGAKRATTKGTTLKKSVAKGAMKEGTMPKKPTTKGTTPKEVKATAERVLITQTRGLINRPRRQKATMQALGLGRIGRTVEKTRTPQIEGMIRSVAHLVRTAPAKLHPKK